MLNRVPDYATSSRCVLFFATAVQCHCDLNGESMENLDQYIIRTLEFK